MFDEQQHVAARDGGVDGGPMVNVVGGLVLALLLHIVIKIYMD